MLARRVKLIEADCLSYNKKAIKMYVFIHGRTHSRVAIADRFLYVLPNLFYIKNQSDPSLTSRINLSLKTVDNDNTDNKSVIFKIISVWYRSNARSSK